MANIKGVKKFIDINRSQKILRGVVGIKSILWILPILRGVYIVMGPQCVASLKHINMVINILQILV